MNINDIKTYKAIILLNEMISANRIFKTVMNGDDKLLEPLMIELLANGYISINNDEYKPTQQGINAYNTFMKRYDEYLKIYDIYSFVDLQAGEFAFESFFEFDNDNDWDIFKNDERFFDIRIPVAIFKKMNPHEIVFMSFINENRFDTSSVGWQFDVMSDNIWAEIDDIVRTSISIDDIGERTLIAIIKEGTKLMLNLFKEEIEINKQKLEEAKLVNQLASEEEIVETTEIIEEYEDYLDYYDPYYDPYYSSPIWFSPIIIW